MMVSFLSLLCLLYWVIWKPCGHTMRIIDCPLESDSFFSSRYNTHFIFSFPSPISTPHHTVIPSQPLLLFSLCLFVSFWLSYYQSRWPFLSFTVNTLIVIIFQNLFSLTSFSKMLQNIMLNMVKTCTYIKREKKNISFSIYTMYQKGT